MNIFNLPDLGEGLAEAEIVAWHVKLGDDIEVDQPLVSMETAKAVVEVPSPVRAKVVKFFGTIGDIIKTGSPLVAFEDGHVLNKQRSTDTVAGQLKQHDVTIETDAILSDKIATSKKGGSVKIMPAVRILAQKMGIDLNTLTPTGPNGSITIDDVMQSKKSSALPKVATPKGSTWVPLRRVRRSMSQSMTQSHQTVVPVTVVEDVILPQDFDAKKITVSVIQALCVGVQQEPNLNAWYDGDNMASCLLPSINLGIAMDLPSGLFLPVIQNAQDQSAVQLRDKIEQLKTAVQTQTIAPKDLLNPSIVLSNFGKFAGRFATPIVIPPTVAILGVGRLRQEPIVRSGQCVAGSVLPLALTVDHRAITGGEAARFLKVVMDELMKKSK